MPAADIRKPELAVLPADVAATANVEIFGGPVTLYYLYIDETGRIAAIRHIQGPRLDTVERELYRFPVVTPARRGFEFIPMVVGVALIVK